MLCILFTVVFAVSIFVCCITAAAFVYCLTSLLFCSYCMLDRVPRHDICHVTSNFRALKLYNSFNYINVLSKQCHLM